MERTTLFNEKDVLLGDVINYKYKIERLIGKGSMGRVYLARNIKLGNLWAIKVVGKDSKMAERFREEAEILKTLNHPNIPHIIDMFEDYENIYVVETYIEGVLLKDHIVRNKKLDVKEAMSYFRQLAEVLLYLHSKKPYPVIYKDIKPNNIIISHSNRLMLIDFSISKFYDKEKEDDTLVSGNYFYSSPEQMKYISRSDERSDIFSLGMLGIRMLTGALHDDIKVDLDSYIEVPYYIRDILEVCIKEDPSNRYSSIGELLEDLNNIDNMNINFRGYRKRVIFIDGTRGSGKSTLASAMAHFYSEKGLSVALVDLSNEIGLAAFFDGEICCNIKGAVELKDTTSIKKAGIKVSRNISLYKGEIDEEEGLIAFVNKLSKINDMVIIEGHFKRYTGLYDYSDEVLFVTKQEERHQEFMISKFREYIEHNIFIGDIKVIINEYVKGSAKKSSILKNISLILEANGKKEKVLGAEVFSYIDRSIYMKNLKLLRPIYYDSMAAFNDLEKLAKC